ncbi:MAG: YraN family protein [Bacteroidales bacterium]|nr:YraN family protein [Bacteroidales bacterium]
MEGKTNTVNKGRWAEDVAASWLSERGLRILERNYRHHHLEVDIIAEGPILSAENSHASDNAQRYLHFVEVRARASSLRSGIRKEEADAPFVAPELTVAEDKQRRLINAADAYVRSHRIHLEAVFDIIGIEKTATGERISFRPDAFRPSW